ncbi:MAG: PmoA family protein [Phycisphaerae bacterium]|nr:PmoA family protein [Phycisphaerae bacterium]
MTRNLLLTTPLFLALGCGHAAEYTVTVKAGDAHRKDTPVSVVLPVPKQMAQASGLAVAEGQTVPAQVATIGEGAARVWWTVSDLSPGQSKTYTIRLGPGVCPQSTKVFKWVDSSKGKVKSADLLFGDRPVLRYMYTPFDKSDIELTKKPFHNVFSPDGSRMITQSVGGKRYPHHRGIFFGYKCKIGDQTYDVWHAHKGEHQRHAKTVLEVAGPVVGGHVVRIDWNDRQGKPFVVETRSLFVYRQSDGNLLIDFTSTLTPTHGPVSLGGDRQHAGVHWRSAPEVAENDKQTRYLRPAKYAGLDPAKEHNAADYKDLPWNAIRYAIGDQTYTVADLTSPKNPDGAEFSERLYGRFGEFFPWELRDDNPLAVRYRWWITDAPSVTRDDVERHYQDLANPPEVVVN